MSHDVANLARATAVTSYSPLDVQWLRDQGIDAHHLPNAFDRDRQVVRPMVRRDEISFVGARYPDREQTLRRAARGRRARPRLRSRLVAPPGRPAAHLGLAPPGRAAERDVDRDTAYAVMAASAATLSMHTDQDGFAMRTFEACGSGAVQLIDRPDLAGLYDDGVELATLGDVRGAARAVRRGPASTSPWARGPARGGAPAHPRRAHLRPPGRASWSSCGAEPPARPRRLARLAALALAAASAASTAFRTAAAARAARLTTMVSGPRVLVVLDWLAPTSLMALFEMTAHLSAPYAVLSPAPSGPDRLDRRGRSLVTRDATSSRRSSRRCGGGRPPATTCRSARSPTRGRDAWARAFVAVQHGLLTPTRRRSPPTPHLLAWSDADADFWTVGAGRRADAGRRLAAALGGRAGGTPA